MSPRNVLACNNEITAELLTFAWVDDSCTRLVMHMAAVVHIWNVHPGPLSGVGIIDHGSIPYCGIKLVMANILDIPVRILYTIV